MEQQQPRFENAERVRLYDMRSDELREIVKELKIKEGMRKDETIQLIIDTYKKNGQVVSDPVIRLPRISVLGQWHDLLSSLIVPQTDVAGFLTLLRASPELSRFERTNRALFWQDVFRRLFPEYTNASFNSLFGIKGGRLATPSGLVYYDEYSWKKICIWMTWAHRRVLKQMEARGAGLELLREVDGGRISTISIVRYQGQLMSCSVFADKNGFFQGRLLAWNTWCDDKEMNTDQKRLCKELDTRRKFWTDAINIEEIFEGTKNPYMVREIWFALTEIAANQRVDEHAKEAWRKYPHIGPMEENGTRIFLGACVVCQTPTQFVCEGCKTAAYCGKDCQSQHWKAGGHAKECAK